MRNRKEVIQVVMRELERVEIQHPIWPNDPIHVVGIIEEEVGEAMREAINLIYFRESADRDRLQKELVQTAAMAIRALINIDQINK